MKDLLVHEWKALVLVGFLGVLGTGFLVTALDPPMSERVLDAVAQPVQTSRPPAPPVHVAQR